ncbi:MAG TPA: DUF922 domain-containing protein, partial [Gammaproteobacteria bacterium]|nr:DUF922 domain-containing protein [Gammaproteobacteria bacterium]
GTGIEPGVDGTYGPGNPTDEPGPIGLDARRGPRVVRRVVTSVTKDWDPPSPRSMPEIVVRGRTLEQVGQELSALPEWGEGGGMIRSERIPPGTSAEIEVHLHANLVKRLPRWTKYDNASAAAKREWDRMMRALTAHEERHVEIAVEEANQCATDLMGVEIEEIARIVTEANRRMHDRQVEYDNDTDHGQRDGVDLDISIA